MYEYLGTGRWYGVVIQHICSGSGTTIICIHVLCYITRILLFYINENLLHSLNLLHHFNRLLLCNRNYYTTGIELCYINRILLHYINRILLHYKNPSMLHYWNSIMLPEFHYVTLTELLYNWNSAMLAEIHYISKILL